MTTYLYNVPHEYGLLLMKNYMSSSFGGEESWNENLGNGLKAEISLKV